jgi:hypothetical protein
MKHPSKVARVVRAVFRSLALVVLVAAFSVAAPLWGLTGNLVSGLTNEATCARMVKDWGLGQIVAGGLVKLEDLLPPHIMGYLQGDDNAGGAMDELNRALGRSIDATAVEVASQVPAYIAGRREHLQASINLSDFRQTAVNIAVTRVPGGRLMESVIRRGIESTVPLEFSLDTPLGKLEMLLIPVRTSVGHLVSLTDSVGVFSVFILMWICLIGFRLTRIFRWIGAAFLGAGTVGALAGGLLSWFMGLVLPDVVLANRLFQEFMAGSILSFRSTAWAWMITGGSSVVVSFVLSPIARAVGRSWRSCTAGPLFSALASGDGRWTLATLVGLVPASLGYAMGHRRGNPRRAVRASLGGRVIAARVIDCLLPVLVIGSLSGGGSAGFVSRIVAIPLWALFILFWFLRDRPRTLRGFNFVDRICGVVRGRQPGRKAAAASIVRSLPLVGGAAMALIMPVTVAFALVAGLEILSVTFLWPDRTFADLMAGTRARWIGGISR